MNTATRLCLIDVVDPDFATPDPARNLICLASYCIDHVGIPKQHVKILNTAYDDVVREVGKFHPDIIGFSVMTPFYDYTVNLAKKIKKRYPSCLLLIGGYHITGVPELFEPPFDIGIIGEGEQTLAELLTLYQNHHAIPKQKMPHIDGIVYFDEKQKKTIQTPARKLLAPNEFSRMYWDLLPNYRVISYHTVLDEGKPRSLRLASMYSARGCPYKCLFCAHQIMWGGQQGFRLYPTKLVGDEIEYLHTHYHINGLQILDDTFAVSKKRLRELIAELRKRKLLGKIRFCNVFVRANLIDEEFAKLLKEFGAISVFIGMESGNQRVLNFLKKGSLKIDDIKHAVEIFDRLRIHMVGSFMRFSPNETRADMEDTLTLSRWFMTHPYAQTLLFNNTTPYPGTELWNYAVQTHVIHPKKPISWIRFFLFSVLHPERKAEIFFTKTNTKKDRDYFFKETTDLANAFLRRSMEKPGWSWAEWQTKWRNKLLAATGFVSMRWKQFLLHPLAVVSRIVHGEPVIRNFFRDGLHLVK